MNERKASNALALSLSLFRPFQKLLTPMGMIGVNRQKKQNPPIATHIAEMVADISNFTTIQSVIQVSRVL